MQSFTRVRVSASELVSIRSRVVRDGERYSGADLDGALMDVVHALSEGGFSDTKFRRTGDIGRMIVLQCGPADAGHSPDEVIDRLEAVWIKHGAFAHEAHSITAERHLVAFDFVTWWDGGRFLTGRIEVALGGHS